MFNFKDEEEWPRLCEGNFKPDSVNGIAEVSSNKDLTSCHTDFEKHGMEKREPGLREPGSDEMNINIEFGFFSRGTHQPINIEFGFFSDLCQEELDKVNGILFGSKSTQKDVLQDDASTWTLAKRGKKRRGSKRLTNISPCNERNLRIDISEDFATYVKPGGFCAKKEKTEKSKGGGKPEGKNRGKRKHGHLVVADVYLEQLCKDDSNLHENGPFGKVCSYVKLKNNKQNRKRLQTYWRRKKNQQQQRRASEDVKSASIECTGVDKNMQSKTDIVITKNNFEEKQTGSGINLKSIQNATTDTREKAATNMTKTESRAELKLQAAAPVECHLKKDFSSFVDIFNCIDGLLCQICEFRYVDDSSDNTYMHLKEILTEQLTKTETLNFQDFEKAEIERKKLISIIDKCQKQLDDKKRSFKASSSVEIDSLEKSENSCASFSNDTISSILDFEMPKTFFTFDLPEKSSFNIDHDIWEDLYINRKRRQFKRNSWENHFIRGVKQSNPHCVLSFKNHHVSSATKRAKKSNAPYFYAKACCVFADCNVVAVLKMMEKYTVNISYFGNLKHAITEQHHRNITGSSREQLKVEFKNGIKPLHSYIKKFNEIPVDQILSGNRDGIGKNSHVYGQIAAESRQVGRRDNELVKSLIIQLNEMKQSLDGGFIQKVSVFPFYILYWSNFGLKIYNDRAPIDILFWDATGSVVRRGDNGKQFLYYELAVRHPVKGKMGIPVSAMISEDQSLPVILDWIRSFRNAEKKRFGHSKSIEHPRMIISDQAMVLILAALKEFNGESMDEFLSRSWNICHGTASPIDVKKTLLHLCASHFMNSVKRMLKKKDVGVKKIKVFLHMTGLLMNCSTVPDAEELLFDIIVVLRSNTMHKNNNKNFQRLFKKINLFQTAAEDIKVAVGSCEPDGDFKSTVNPSLFTEEDFQVVGTTSPFKQWTTNNFEKSDSYSREFVGNSEPNPWKSELFLDYLIKRLMPIYPLWSSILLGDLSRYNKDYNVPEIKLMPKTNSLIENRFRILKHLYLNGRSQHRLDEFSELLKDQTIGIQRIAASDSLKLRTALNQGKRKKGVAGITSPKRQKTAKCSTLVEEQWDKHKPQHENFKKSVGKYQKPPNTKYVIPTSEPESVGNTYQETQESLPKQTRRFRKRKVSIKKQTGISSVCLLRNYGLTCWFNSVIQSIYFSTMSSRMLDYFSEQNSIEIDIDMNIPPTDKAVQSIVDIWRLMSCDQNKGKQIPDSILQPAIRTVCTAIPGFTQSAQQDVHEFNTYIIRRMGEMLNYKIEMAFEEICTSCNTKTVKSINDGQTITIHLQPEINDVSVHTLLYNHFLSEERLQHCLKCSLQTMHILNKTINSLPPTLVVALGRYHSENINGQARQSKLHNVIAVNDSISFETISPHQAHTYKLKSVVCHRGETLDSGHYVSLAKLNEQWICCNDDKISPADKDEVLQNSYLIIYDKNTKLPDYADHILNCVLRTDGFKSILRDERIKFLDENKIELLQSLIQQGYSGDIKNRVTDLLGPCLLEAEDRMSVSLFYELFLSYFFKGDFDYLKSEYFKVSSKYIFSCQNCDNADVLDHTLSVVPVKLPHTEGILADSMKKLYGGRVVKICKCNKLRLRILFLSLPYTLIFHISNCLGFSVDDYCSIDFRGKLDTCFPLDSMQYTLESVVCFDGQNYCTFKKTNIGFFEPLSSRHVTDLSMYSEVYLIFAKRACAVEKFLIEDINILNEIQPVMIVSNDLFTFEKTTNAKIYNRVKLDKQFFSYLTAEKGWLTSDHINVYLSMLSTAKIHVVDCAWFSTRLFRNGDFQEIQWVIPTTESTKHWLTFDFVVVPINEYNTHWTMIVVDIMKQRIFYCNSLGRNGDSSNICLQAWRYICYESLIHSKKVLERHNWSVVHYSDAIGFPRQTDSSSCGVYVCATAKAITSGCKLPNESNLFSFRHHMAREIWNST